MYRVNPAPLLACALVWLGSPLAQAEPADCVTSSAGALPEGDLPQCDSLYPPADFPGEPSPWRIGLGAGYGERSNPMINADEIPIYGIVQLSYFGEHFFFDNGDVGWFIAEDKHWQLNAVAGVGGERSFFSFLNEGSISFNPGSLTGESDTTFEPGAPPTEGPGDELTIEERELEAPERDYTIDGGLELLYFSGGSELQLQLLTDLSGRHHGQEIWASWARPVSTGRLQLVPSLGLTWKSSAAADYYYGVRESEARPGMPAYSVDDAINPFARLTFNYRLNADWRLVGVWQYEHLASTIRHSPSVEDDGVRTAFIGLYYEF